MVVYVNKIQTKIVSGAQGSFFFWLEFICGVYVSPSHYFIFFNPFTSTTFAHGVGKHCEDVFVLKKSDLHQMNLSLTYLTQV